jgi:hypothetical protein
VLLSVIERLLPKDFFSPSLIVSRADQAVLDDIVRQLAPRVHAHLAQLGVDLARVTFGWFLSIFTDCLPVEVGGLLQLALTADPLSCLGCLLRRGP